MSRVGWKSGFALALTFLFGLGCQSTARTHSDLGLGPKIAWENSRAFMKAVQLKEVSSSNPKDANHVNTALEKARIDYLLERTSASPYNFIRNGSRYTARRGTLHLKWKRFQNLGKVKTAEDFIHLVASGSKVSGEPYLIEYPDRRRHPLRLLLVDELKEFDEAVRKYRKRMTETASEPPQPSS